MESNPLPRVFIIDHSTAVIERLAESINDVARVIGHATNAHDTLHRIRDECPHLTVLDIAVDNGIDLLKEIKRHQPLLSVAIFTHSVEDTTRHYCMRLGAEYFLDKLSEFDKVREIVIAIGNGHRPAAPVSSPQH